MNGGTRLSYYKYTIEVRFLHIYFVVSVIIWMLTFSIYLSFVYLFIYNNIIFIN